VADKVVWTISCFLKTEKTVNVDVVVLPDDDVNSSLLFDLRNEPDMNCHINIDAHEDIHVVVSVDSQFTALLSMTRVGVQH